MNDSKAGGPIEKKSLRRHILSKIGVVGHPKMINSELAACFAVAGVQICLLDTNKISSSDICTTAKQAALSKKQSLRHHIFSKIRVVGYPKIIIRNQARFSCIRNTDFSSNKTFVKSTHNFSKLTC